MNTYTLYWKTGDREIVEGDTPGQAMTLAGYSRGALRALDFYAEGDDHDYKFYSIKRDWIPVIQEL